MKKKFLKLLCAITIFSNCLQFYNAQEQNTFNLDSESAVIMDANTKRVLYSYNGDKQQYPASITKVMTMLVGVESKDVDRKVTISE